MSAHLQLNTCDGGPERLGPGGGGGGGGIPGSPGGKLFQPKDANLPNVCEAMAEWADLLGMLFSSDTGAFVHEFGNSIAGVGGREGTNANRVLRALGNDRWDPIYYGVGPTTGPGGPTAADLAYPGAFNPQFRDSLDPAADQSHHFAAFLQLGYAAGFRAAAAYAYQIDYFPNDPTRNNPGDVALGLQGATIGSLLRSGQVAPGGVGDWIRLNICNPTGTP